MTEKQQVNFINVLSLAYLGDSAFSFFVRNHLVNKYDYKPNKLNKIANSVVCAKTQAEIMLEILPELSEEEKDIAMRARNSHTNSKAKNSTLQEYNLATQFEALVGYWTILDGDRLKYFYEKFVVGRL